MGTLRLRLTPTTNTATINIVKMDLDGVVELTYKKMWAATASTGFATVTVTSDGTAEATFPALGDGPP